MSLRLDQPELLWLLLLALPMLWLGHRRLTTVEPLRRGIALGLRVAVLLLLVLILAGLRAERRHTDLTVIAVVDRSPSIRVFGEPDSVQPGQDDAPATPAPAAAPGTTPQPPSLLQTVGDYLRRAAGEQRPDDRFGVVAYDQRPTVVSRPGPGTRFELSDAAAAREGTDTAAALEWAMASKADADTALRLVLVSDGNDTAGDTLAAARSAAAAGVPVDVLPLGYRVQQEVMVEGVYTPVEAREGQTIAVRVVLRATAPSRGTLQLRHDGDLLDLNADAPGRGWPIAPEDWSDARVLIDQATDSPSDPQTAPPDDAAGRFLLVKQVDVPITTAGANNFQAIFEPHRPPAIASASAAPVTTIGRGPSSFDTPTDTVAINNRAESFTLVQGRGRVLLVDYVGGTPGRILPEALRSREINLDVIPPAAFPQDAAQLARYDAVLFQNVPAETITGRQQTTLARYVNDLGGGFAMLGGPDSFGAGGWTNTVIDRSILPVHCEIPSQTVLPTGALVICIDRSGSMAAPVGNSKRTQLELAGEAAILAMQTLYEDDLIGLIAFDSAPTWIVPLQPNTNPANAEKLIRSMTAAGGTNLSTGLQLAYDSLSDLSFADRSVRHCILLTDGYEPAYNYQALMDKFDQAGITLTTVGIGEVPNTALLQDLAIRGDGQYYPVADPFDLPQIFIKEARLIRKNLIREGQFQPRSVNTGSPVTANLATTPPLNGLVLTGARYDRRVDMPLLGPEGEPLFAHWQVGLGRAAAWTSDATNRWATPWLTWPGYADFWARTVRYLSRPARSQDAELTASLDGDTLRVRLDLTQAPASPDADATPSTVAGKLLRPDGSITDLTLQQTGPGIYGGAAPAAETGNYLVNLFYTAPDADGSLVPQFVAAGTTRVPGQELRRFAPNLALLRQVAEITGGRVLDPADPVAANLFDRSHRFESVSTRPLRWLLLPWLLALLLLDIANRRLAWDHRAIAAWIRQRLSLPARSAEQTRATLDALKSRRQGVPPADSPAPAAAPHAPVSARPAPVAKPRPRATPNPPPRPATAPAPPTPKPPTPTPEPEPLVDPDQPTSRLLAAKRRARQRHS